MNPVAFPGSNETSSRAQLWAVVCAFVGLSALAVSGVGLKLDLFEYSDIIIGVFGAAGLSLMRGRITAEPVRRFCDFLETLGLMGALCLAGAFASMGLAAMSSGYSDATLGAADARLGMNWQAAYGFVADQPWAQWLGKHAYRSIFWTPLFLLGILCALGRGRVARQLVMTYTIALTLTLIIFALVPAAGPLTYYGLADGPYAPISSDEQVRLIEAVRAAKMITIHKQDLIGIVSFPSFHAASACIFIWAGWRVPLARFVFLAVNVAMLVATPIEGNHYLIDLIGGAAVAVAAVAIARWASEVTWSAPGFSTYVMRAAANDLRGEPVEPPMRKAA